MFNFGSSSSPPPPPVSETETSSTSAAESHADLDESSLAVSSTNATTRTTPVSSPLASQLQDLTMDAADCANLAVAGAADDTACIKNNEDETNAASLTGNGKGKKMKRSRRRVRRRGRKSAQVQPMTRTATNTMHLTHPYSSVTMTTTTSVDNNKQHDAPMTKSDLYFALDCEMVGIGPDGFDSAVARVTVVNWDAVVVLDTFVKVPVEVTDYRTHVSGIQPQDIVREDAMTYEQVSKAVANILRGKILIGHGLENDLCALGLTHPWCDVRDTAMFGPYMQEIPSAAAAAPSSMDAAATTSTAAVSTHCSLRARKLRDLARETLGRNIQQDGVPHSPIEDAVAALDLYKARREEWEEELRQRIKEQEERRAAEAAAAQQQQQQQHRSWFSAMSIHSSAAAAAAAPQHHYHHHHGHMSSTAHTLHQDPYGLGIPGYSPLPQDYVQEARAKYMEQEQQQQQQLQLQQQQQSTSSSSFGRFFRRPRSPSRSPSPQPKVVLSSPVRKDTLDTVAEDMEEVATAQGKMSLKKSFRSTRRRSSSGGRAGSPTLYFRRQQQQQQPPEPSPQVPTVATAMVSS